MKKLFILILGLLFTASIALAETVRIGNYDVSFNGVTINQNGTSTWSYTVQGTGTGKALSHWSISLCDVSKAIQSSDYTIGLDPTTGVTGIKWDIPLENFETKTYTFTLNGIWDVVNVEAAIKAGQSVEKELISGPGCTYTPPAKGSLGDKVWLDTNKDGLQNAGEAGIPNVVVELYDCSGNKKTQTTTNNNGLYLFSDLNAGSYRVKFILPSGYELSPMDRGNDNTLDSDAATDGFTDCITLGAGQNDMTWDAGLYMPPPPPAALGNLVWLDVNHNGLQDAGEAGVPGVTVNLFDCSGTYIREMITNAGGEYGFTNLTAGAYKVQFILPAGYEFTVLNQGTNDEQDSDAGTAGLTECITLSIGQTDNSWDAGLYMPPPPTSALGNFVWLDANHNGLQDAGEAGVPGVTVKLFDCSETYIRETITNAGGEYGFSNLTAGAYKVQIILPAGYEFTVLNQGTNKEKDSDAGIGGLTDCISLSIGQTDNSWDAGLYMPPPPQKASLGDLIWHDQNHDGIQDNGETGISGVRVELRLCSNHDNLVAFDITDADGKYLFTDLTPGVQYFIRVIVPAEYPSISPINQGNSDALDSDIGQDAQSDCITLDAGENDLSNDAGLYAPAPQVPDLKIEKMVSKTDPECGEPFTYTVKVTNLGPVVSNNIMVRDLLPAQLDYISSTPSQGTYNAANGEWTVGTLAASANATLSIVVKVKSTSVGTIDLGPAAGFNLFVLTDLTQPSADTQGKIAVGNNASLSGYSVADLLPPGSGDVLIVGNNLTYTSGSVHGGNVVYGGTSNLPQLSVTIHDGTVRKQAGVINFAAAKTYLEGLSKNLAAYPVNGTTTFQWGEIKLTGTDAALNVFNVNGSDLGNAHTVTINAPATSIVIVNISGTSVNWKGGLYLNGVSMNNVIYNFYQATTLSIGGIDVKGAVLAPFAALTYNSGIITGQAIVKSMTGSGQFNLNLFTGKIPAGQNITNNAELISSVPADPNPANNNASVTILTSVIDDGDGEDEGDGDNGDGDDQSGMVPIPTPSWPVGNPTEYNNPPTLYWYLGAPGTGITYEIQCVPASTPWPNDNIIATSSTTSFTVPFALAPGVQYAWRVRSTNGVTKSAWSATALFTIVGSTSCQPVVPVASWPIENATQYINPPTLNWYLGSAGTGLTYEIQCVPASAPWPADNIIATSSTMSFTIPFALAPGVQYSWRVRSTNGVTKSAWSATALFTMVANNSGEPVVPTASWPVDNAIEYNSYPTFHWYLGTYAPGLSYEIQCVAASASWPADNVFATSSTMSFTMPYALIPGVQYAWRVRSTNGITKSAWSTTALFTMVSNLSGNPVIPITSWPIENATVYNTIPTFNWYLGTASVGLTYEIQCVAASASWPADNIFAASTTTSFTMPYSLTPGVQYAWRVRSTNGMMKSNWSATALFTVAAAANSGPVVPIASWPIGNATEYNLKPIFHWYIGANIPGLTYEIQCVAASAPWPDDHVFATSTTTSFTMPYELVPGVQYAWRIRSTNGMLKSNWSTTALFTMASNNSCVQPITASPGNSVTVTADALQLFWYLPTASEGISAYEIQLADNPEFQSAQTFSSAESKVQVNGLAGGKEYFWKVRSIDAAGNSSYYSGISQFKVNSTTAVKEEKDAPTSFELSQNYPNPFNPSTVIRFSIPEAGYYTLKVYDMLGQEIVSLVDGEMSIGVHDVTFDAGNLTSGTYIYRLSGSNVNLLKKMLLVK